MDRPRVLPAPQPPRAPPAPAAASSTQNSTANTTTGSYRHHPGQLRQYPGYHCRSEHQQCQRKQRRLAPAPMAPPIVPAAPLTAPPSAPPASTGNTTSNTSNSTNSTTGTTSGSTSSTSGTTNTFSAASTSNNNAATNGGTCMDRRRLTLWLAFASLVMSAAVVNFIKFAARPSLPICWIDQRTEAARNLSKKIDGEPEDARRQDLESYLWLLFESRQRKEAHDTAAAMQPLRPTLSGYDPQYTQRLHRLACAELFHDCSDDTLITMQQLYDYDRRHLPAGDRTIFRDCNNLGLACFLVGQNSSDQAFRHNLFAQAGEWLSKAEAGFAASDNSDLLSVKENELMLAEALKNGDAADRCRMRIDNILAKINGPAARVQL